MRSQAGDRALSNSIVTQCWATSLMVLSAAVLALVATGLVTSSASARDTVWLGQDQHVKLDGVSQDDRVCSSASIGDFNADGIDDTAVSACGSDEAGKNAGAVYVVFGSKEPIVQGSDSYDLADLISDKRGVQINGPAQKGDCSLDPNRGGDKHGGPSGWFASTDDACPAAGYSVAGAGDFNGDKVDDIVVGVRGYDTAVNGQDVGAAFVVFGSKTPTSTISLADIDRSCKAAKGAPTCNKIYNDGGPDGFVITGGDDDDFGDGAVPADRRGDELGSSVDGAGDFNNDGLDDIVVGAPNTEADGGVGKRDAGTAYVVFGQQSGVAKVDGGAEDLYLNRVDISQDAQDAGAGSNSFPDNKIGMAIYGAAGTGWKNGDEAGRSVAGVGDVNGDGIEDVAIGAWGSDANGADAGVVYLVYGWDQANTSVRPDRWRGKSDNRIGLSDWADDGTCGAGCRLGQVIRGSSEADAFGYSVGRAGDVNGDGLADVAIGAPGTDADSNADSGTGYVVFGRRDGAISTDVANDRTFGISVDGQFPGGGLGMSVHSVGDQDADGKDDVLFAAPYEDFVEGVLGGSNSGSVWLIYGGNARSLRTRNLARNDGVSIVGEKGCALCDFLGPGDEVGAGLSEVETGLWRTLTGGNTGEVAFDGGGQNVGGGGDFNADGISDLIVGAPFVKARRRLNSGAAYIQYGTNLKYQSKIETQVGGSVSVSPSEIKSTGKTRFTLATADGSGTGKLPEGVELAADTGAITGMPKQAQDPVVIRVRVTDALGVALSPPISVTTAAAPEKEPPPPPVDTPVVETKTDPPAKRYCAAPSSRLVRGRPKKLGSVGSVAVVGPSRVSGRSSGKGSLFSVVPASVRRPANLKRVRSVGFTIKRVGNSGKPKKIGKSKRALSRWLGGALEPGNYQLAVKIKPARGRAATLKLKVMVVASC